MQRSGGLRALALLTLCAAASCRQATLADSIAALASTLQLQRPQSSAAAEVECQLGAWDCPGTEPVSPELFSRVAAHCNSSSACDVPEISQDAAAQILSGSCRRSCAYQMPRSLPHRFQDPFRGLQEAASFALAPAPELALAAAPSLVCPASALQRLLLVCILYRHLSTELPARCF